MPEPAQIETQDRPRSETGRHPHIDLAAIVKNWKRWRTGVFCGLRRGRQGRAYGCGIDKVAAALAEAGCATFFAPISPSAPRSARRARRSAHAAIYVLNGFPPGTARHSRRSTPGR